MTLKRRWKDERTIKEIVFASILSQFSNEITIFDIAGFICPDNVVYKKRFCYKDPKTGKPRYTGKSSIKLASDLKNYLIHTKKKRYNLPIKEVKGERYPSIEDRTRTEIHKAIDRINQKLILLLNLKEENKKDYYIIIKEEKNKFKIDKDRFYRWLEILIQNNSSFSEENKLHPIKKILQISKIEETIADYFYKTTEDKKSIFNLSTPSIILNRIYLKNGRVDFKIKPQVAYLKLLEYLLALASEGYSSKNVVKIRLNTQNPK